MRAMTPMLFISIGNRPHGGLLHGCRCDIKREEHPCWGRRSDIGVIAHMSRFRLTRARPYEGYDGYTRNLLNAKHLTPV